MAAYGLTHIIGTLFSGISCCLTPGDLIGAKSHGDIIIGGLLSVHGKIMNSPTGYPNMPALQNCAGFEMQGFLQMLAMSHAIEMINNSSLIPGIKLGYEIYDTCSEVTMALSATMRLLSAFNSSEDNLKFKCNYTTYTPKVKAIVGDSYSEVSIAVARLLNAQFIPLVVTWSAATTISSIPDIQRVGRVIGFTFKSGAISPFLNYLKNLNRQHFEMNRLLDQYAWLLYDCPKVKYNELFYCISNYSKESIYNIERERSRTLREDFQNRYSQDLYLLQSLNTVNFTFDGRNIHFDSRGDANTGYDVLMWMEDNDGRIDISTVAKYDSQKDSFVFKNTDKENEFKRLKSTCSDQCKPGQMKKTSASLHTCCYECVACPENHHTNKSDMGYCLRCNNKTQWSPVNSSVCYYKEIKFLRWNDGFAIILLIVSFLGKGLIIAIALLFTKKFNTPVVKASGGILCYIILLSIFFSFVSAVFFIGKPEDFKCKVRQTLFGISFTVVVACILLKSVLICAAWLVFWPPHMKENFSLPQTIILECDEGSTVAFTVMVVYIAILAFLCFIFAFKGRKLPENYNEAKFITFGMLIYSIAWITFIPIYATTFDIYLPAVEMIVILISSYGILTCTFFPKCYIILYKQDANTKTAFIKMIYKYSSKSASNLTVSQASSSSDALKFSSSDVNVSSTLSCISNTFSFHERLVATDISPSHTRLPTRKRLSSI
ncbi:hypothetical protein XELAEV_18029235mg [Xenopus laevis]|uniref:G-protein coupled receptor family C group 6 member A n=1 Tax=Xenopus laevis TaxID=8355 RepID=A0A974CR45_XENLA|nr:hypothetical protein XELAEV_18029235mg [Xenopus laevis]